MDTQVTFYLHFGSWMSNLLRLVKQLNPSITLQEILQLFVANQDTFQTPLEQGSTTTCRDIGSSYGATGLCLYLHPYPCWD